MINARETTINNKIEITITFDKEDFDFFSLDKGDAKEWIRNACHANNASRLKLLKKELAEKEIITDERIKKRITELITEKNNRPKN